MTVHKSPEPLDLDAIEALRASATPLPWWVVTVSRDESGELRDDADGLGACIMSNHAAITDGHVDGEIRECDAAYAVATANAFPALAARVRELETENRYLRDREAHFAKVLGVCDGGRHRADWNAAIERVVEERSAALALVKELESKAGAPLSFVLPNGLLRLPPKILAELGVGVTGRGVHVLKRQDHPYVELLTNEQWYESLGDPPAPETNDE